jgi:hypothetical protein
LADASVTLPPTRRVAAKSASAVRDWVMLPSVGFLNFSILVPRCSIATYAASGTPVPLERCTVDPVMRQKIGR